MLQRLLLEAELELLPLRQVIDAWGWDGLFLGISNNLSCEHGSLARRKDAFSSMTVIVTISELSTPARMRGISRWR